MRRWLFGVVAREFVYKGFRRADLNRLVKAEGDTALQFVNRFPNTQALAIALIDEICGAFFEEYSERSRTEKDPYQRLTLFFISGHDFLANNLLLAQVIINALFGSDRLLHDHVVAAFSDVVEAISEDLLQAMIIPNRSPLLMADLTSNLLSLLFMQSPSQLEMQYLSFVDPRKVGFSALEALKKRYQAGRHLAAM